MKPLSLASKLAPAPNKKGNYTLSLFSSGVVNKKKLPKGLKSPVHVVDPRAVRSVLALMNLAAINGGAACHWGGPSAMVEIWSALHSIMFSHKKWYDHFHFINDIGHAENAIYAIRGLLGFDDLSLDSLMGFRSLDSKLTGHGESHLNPENVLLSNGPLSSAFTQAQGLCFADKLSGSKRVTVASLSDGASMEGEAKESFAAIAGLAQKNKMNPFVLIISDNNTKLSGRIDVDSFSMKGTFESLETLGWDVMRVDDGHDLEDVYINLQEAIEKAKENPLKPVCLWVKTIKGYGIQKTVTSQTGGHGFPLKAHDPEILHFLKEIWKEEEVPHEFVKMADGLLVHKSDEKLSDSSLNFSDVKEEKKRKKQKIQVGVSAALCQLAKEGLPVFSVSSDLQGSTGLKKFHEEFPEHFVDVGIAESNMISMAVGMSKAGYIPVVDTFAAFGVTKGNLPLIMGQLSEAPIIGVFSHTGFQDAADGASHQSLTYLSALSSIPNLNVVNLASSTEAQEYIYQAAKKIQSDRLQGHSGESYIFFLGRENFYESVKEDLRYDLHRGQKLTDGKDASIIVTGSLVQKALQAYEQLKEQGLKVTVINHSFVNHFDVHEMATWISESGNKVVTLEDHQLIGGMGAQLTHQLKLIGLEFQLKSLAVKGKFGQSAYQADELYAKHELDVGTIVSTVESLQKKTGAFGVETEVFKLKWSDLSHEIKLQWDSFSDQDLEKAKDNIFSLIALVQEKFGISREDAIKKIQELSLKVKANEIKAVVEEKAKIAMGTASSLIEQMKIKIKK